jgi:diaminohydroxyphosphoribosylaminopyrimidine deaminase/5-amino-6-(5-phosphoribosylamino)uracil reductase
MSTRWSRFDRDCMNLALALAVRGQGRVEPNPMVGCVLAKNGRIVGRGYHKKFGGPHAEVEALRDAGSRARGATAYVTLEPCCHYGKTPPCTEALITAGVRRVVAALKDPNPLVSGRGFRKLRQAGITCDVGLLEDEARRLNAPFITRQKKRRPYVILKWAQSLDGKIATRTGDSKWISSAASRRRVHELRARVDAILVGISTVLIDDPDLTARGVRRRRIATRIVLDSNLKTPLAAKLVRTARHTPTLLFCRATRSHSTHAQRLRARGCEIIGVPTARGGISLKAVLRTLHDRGMTNLLVEGGGCVLGRFIDQHLADEALIFVAPKLIGGETAPGPLRNIGPATMRDLPVVACQERMTLDEDLCYSMRFH